MDKKYIEENEIEIKYLRNQLTPEEVEEFEVYLMENPEALESLELGQTFSDELPNLHNASSGSFLTRIKAFFKDNFLSAYSLGLLSAAVFFVGSNLTQFASTPKSNFSQVVYLSTTRSVSEEGKEFVNVEFPKSSFRSGNQDKLVLALDTGLLQEAEYEVFVESVLDSRGFELSKVKTDSVGQAVILIDLNQLKVGRYHLMLKASENKNILDFGFRVSEEPKPK